MRRETEPDADETRAGARARAIKELDGKTVWDVADMYAVEALVVLHEGLDSDDEKLRAASARDLAYVWSRLPPRPALPPEKGVTPEEWRQRAEAAALDENVQRFMLSHPAMQAAMAAMGWKPPAGVVVPGKERN